MVGPTVDHTSTFPVLIMCKLSMNKIFLWLGRSRRGDGKGDWSHSRLKSFSQTRTRSVSGVKAVRLCRLTCSAVTPGSFSTRPSDSVSPPELTVVMTPISCHCLRWLCGWGYKVPLGAPVPFWTCSWDPSCRTRGQWPILSYIITNWLAFAFPCGKPC